MTSGHGATVSTDSCSPLSPTLCLTDVTASGRLRANPIREQKQTPSLPNVAF